MLTEKAIISAQELKAQMQSTSGVELRIFNALHSACGNLSEKKIGEELGPIETSEDENGRTSSQTTYYVMVLVCSRHNVESASWKKAGTNIAVF